MSLRSDLEARVAAGLVVARDDGPLRIYAYSPECVYSAAWDEVTCLARGLVLGADDRIVARPFRKFFNLNERPETTVGNLPAGIPEFADKLDGSLVIAFFDPFRGAWRATTRGAFDSRQARFGNGWLAGTATDAWRRERTYCFELTAPWNRIVLPYAEERMTLLGTVENESGAESSYGEAAVEAARLGLLSIPWAHRPVAGVDLSDPAVHDREGFVVRFANGLRVKMKYAAYLEVHRIVTGLTVKGVWERMAEGRPIPMDRVPDEFLRWYEGKRAAIQAARDALAARVEEAWLATPEFEDRKSTALRWAPLDGVLKACLFRRLDGKPYEAILWKAVRPETGEGWFSGEQ